MSTRAKAGKKKKKTGRRRLLPLLMIFLLIAALIGGWKWINYPQGIIPGRDAALAAGADKLYLLLVGSDRNESVSDSSRADTVMVAAIDFARENIFLISLPRDSYVEIPGYGEDKINHAYAYGGVELLEETVELLLGVPIDYYALVDFNSFEDIIDVLGGVEIDVDRRMYYRTYDALIDIEAGLQRLNGEQALQYVRYRSDALGDITRVSRQQLLLQAVFEEFTGGKGLSKLPQILPAVNQALETDLSAADMLRLAWFAGKTDSNALTTQTISGDFMSKNGISYWQIDQSELKALVENSLGGGS